MRVSIGNLRKIIREASINKMMINNARSINRQKMHSLFMRFDDLENKLSKMNYSHPEFESVNSEYDVLENELDKMGLEITSTINPFKVSGGKIRDKATGEIVYTKGGK